MRGNYYYVQIVSRDTRLRLTKPGDASSASSSAGAVGCETRASSRWARMIVCRQVARGALGVAEPLLTEDGVASRALARRPCPRWLSVCEQGGALG